MTNKNTIHLDVDIQCSGCADTIAACIQQNQDIPVKSYDINTVSRKLSIYIDSDKPCSYQGDYKQYFKQKLQDYGIRVLAKKPHLFGDILQGVIGLASGLSITAFMLLGTSIPFVILHIIAGLSILLTLILGRNSFFQAFKQLFKARSVSMDTLLVISAVAALSLSLSALFVPGLPMMFGDPLILFGLHHVGIIIRKLCSQKITDGLSFTQRSPKKVIKIIDAQEIEYETDQLNHGDVILLKPGQYLPVDAVCLSQEGLIDTQFHDGSLIFKGAINNANYKAGIRIVGDQAIAFRVLKSAAESTLSKLDQTLTTITKEKSNLEQYTHQMMQFFVPIVMLSSAALGCLNFFYFNSIALATSTMLSVLTAACPCVLGLLSAGTLALGFHKARENGVQFKGTKYLEQAAQIDTVVFDLNGTLTEGRPKVLSCEFIQGVDQAELLIIIAKLETKSNHAFANAIKAYCGITSPIDPLEKQTTVHNGVSGMLKEDTYILGSSDLMIARNIAMEPNLFPTPSNHSHIVYLAKNQQIIGRIQINDPLRPDALSLIHHLKKMNKSVYVCTGASKETALNYCNLLEIDKSFIHCNASTEDKKEFIRTLQVNNKQVAMIGDAANDLLPISQANLGIAMQSGDRLTREAADVIINDHNLQPILTSFTLPNMTISKVNQILTINLMYNLAIISIMGLLLPSAGIAIPAGTGLCFMFMESILLTTLAFQITRAKIPKLDFKTKTAELTTRPESTSIIQESLVLTLKPEISPNQDKTSTSPGHQGIHSFFYKHENDPGIISDSSSIDAEPSRCVANAFK